MIGYTATLSVEQLNDLIRAELPGVQFRVEATNHELMATVEFLRVHDRYRAAISTDVNPYDTGALSYMTLTAIDAFREKAMVDYGLRVILEREKKQAFKDGFAAMVTNLRGYVDQRMRSYKVLRDEENGDPILDEFGDEQEVDAGPSWEGHQILSWLDDLGTPEKNS
jgi:hypothetical protein